MANMVVLEEQEVVLAHVVADGGLVATAEDK
jgi:hypothetical protein